MTDEQATDPASWARQISSTIRFADELDVVLADPDRVLVEVGPGGSLTGSAMRHPKWSSGHRAVRLMRHPVQNTDDRDTFLLGLGQLWSAGVQVDWTPLTGPKRPIVSLPGYPFAHERHWVDPKPVSWADQVSRRAALPAASTNGAAVHRRCRRQRPVGKPRRRCVASGCSAWARLLERNDNFFDLGGDSLIAIGIATNASNAGLDVTPTGPVRTPDRGQPGGRTSMRSYRPAAWRNRLSAESHLPVPPNIARVPRTRCARGRSLAGAADLAARPRSRRRRRPGRAHRVGKPPRRVALQLVDRAGTWEQHIAAPQEFQRAVRRVRFPTSVDRERLRSGRRCSTWWPS